MSISKEVRDLLVRELVNKLDNGFYEAVLGDPATVTKDSGGTSITIEDLVRAKAILDNDTPHQPVRGLPSFRGEPVYVLPEKPRRPKIQLSPSCPVSEEFRIKTNQWYIKMFGYHEDAWATSYYMPGTGLLLTERDYCVVRSFIT